MTRRIARESIITRYQSAMKDSHFHISLYVIIPVIFGGYATLSAILTFQLTQYCISHQLKPESPVFWAAGIFFVIGFLCGLIIVWVLLKPTEKFIRNMQAILPQPQSPDKKKEDPLKEMNYVYNQVTTALSMVAARQLFPDIIAESEVMREILGQVTKVAPTDSTVLITGESGTGKELIAASIYKQSLRKDKPFIKINCVAIPDGLWESELFGHEKGAFTGAVARKIGKFEMANEGTLFLDEIGDMPLETQAKLLRVLQEREFERVGGTRTVKVDVRFIAATNKNLEEMVREKKFREDLFFRLNVIYLKIPPLRDRKEDISLMANHFSGKSPRQIRISPVAMQMLINHSRWQGNVRELQNIIERAAVMTESDMIEPHHLPEHIMGNSFVQGMALSSENNDPETDTPLSLDEQIGRIEKQMITEALRKADGVQKKAAEILAIKERSLWHRIKKYDIDAKSFKTH